MINISGYLTPNWIETGIINTDTFLIAAGCGYQKFITQDFEICRKNGRVDFQLIYLIKGCGWYTFKNETKEIREGNIIIYKPDEPQIYQYYFKDNPELYWIHFSGFAVQDYLDKLSLSNNAWYYVGFNDKCIDLFKKLIYELNIKNFSYECYISAYLLELLSRFSTLSNTTNSEMSLTDKDIKKAVMLIHSNYNKKYSINDLAKDCNLSISRFMHKFKATIGITPMQYFTQIRINEAKDLLSYPSLNISEVSSIIGYGNPLYFSRIFKKETGMSPSEFKKFVAYNKGN
jgi:AraC-like DNA-binding protein